MDLGTGGFPKDVEAFFAEQRAQRDADRKPEGEPWYEDGDPRLELSQLQFRALSLVADGWSAPQIAAYLGVSPERAKRLLLSRKFRKALAREQRKPTSPDFIRLANQIGPGEASRRKALSAGAKALTQGDDDESAT